MTFAGAAGELDQAFARYTVLDRIFTPGTYIITDDTWAGLLAGTGSYSGVCAFAGTGASVYVGDGTAPEGWRGKIDGWGPIIGDFGSAFQLAVEFFRRMGRLWHMREVDQPLFDEVRSFTRSPESELHKLESIERCQRWFDALVRHGDLSWRQKLARISIPITRSADRHVPDELAVSLVSGAADDMLQSLDIAFSKFKVAFDRPISFQGGMFQHSVLYRNIITRRLNEMGYYTASLSKFKPVVGSILIAKNGLGTAIPTEDMHLLTSTIASLPSDQRDMLVY